MWIIGFEINERRNVMEQMTKEQAINFARSEKYLDMSHKERAILQLHQDKLCMPFDVFHESVEKTLGRPVYTHEFGVNKDGLIAELGGAEPPSLADIINMIPEEKRMLVVT
jgi:hypothetical protein